MQDHKTQVRELSDAELDAVAAGTHPGKGESFGAGSSAANRAREALKEDSPATDVLGEGEGDRE
jgi:hypothetical protein